MLDLERLAYEGSFACATRLAGARAFPPCSACAVPAIPAAIVIPAKAAARSADPMPSSSAPALNAARVSSESAAFFARFSATESRMARAASSAPNFPSSTRWQSLHTAVYPNLSSSLNAESATCQRLSFRFSAASSADLG